MGNSPADPSTVRLTVPPEARLLGTIRLVVGIVARKAGIDEEAIEDLKIAVSETCAVAIADLDRAGIASAIELDLIEDGKRFGVEVRDRAPAEARTTDGFDIEDLDDRQFGLALVGALVDDLETTLLEGGGHRTRFWVQARTAPVD